MDSDVLIVSYDKGYGNEIPILLVGRNTDKGMEIIKAFEREEANKVYELLSKLNKSFILLRQKSIEILLTLLCYQKHKH